MVNGAARYAVWACCLLAIGAGRAGAQDVRREDQVLDAMRGRDSIGKSDQERVVRWIEDRITEFTDAAAFTEQFRAQYEHPGNSRQFTVQFVTQTAKAAAHRFAGADLEPDVAYALARVLVDMDRPETFAGLIAGLSAKDARARYLCARGLAAHRKAIAADESRFDQAVRSLREAGLVETSPAVIGRIYEALAYSGRAAGVLGAYMSIFDERLKRRRESRVMEDGAEVYALEFFRLTGVLGALDAGKKAELAARLAVFLRMAAERYNTPGLAFDEIDRIERLLEGVEAILSDPQMAGPDAGGKIRDALSAGGHGNREAVLQAAYRWVGDPKSAAAGALNTAPWNVPVGAP